MYLINSITQRNINFSNRNVLDAVKQFNWHVITALNDAEIPLRSNDDQIFVIKASQHELEIELWNGEMYKVHRAYTYTFDNI